MGVLKCRPLRRGLAQPCDTTICDYAWPKPGQTLAGTIETWKAKACGKAHVDHAFHVVVSEATPERLAEIPEVVRAGYPSLKVFMIPEFGLDDAGLVRVLAKASETRAIVNVHAENGDMLGHATAALLASGKRNPRYYAESRPALAEAEATRRAISYAEFTRAEIYVVHLSCRGALEAVREARRAEDGSGGRAHQRNSLRVRAAAAMAWSMPSPPSSPPAA